MTRRVFWVAIVVALLFGTSPLFADGEADKSSPKLEPEPLDIGKLQYEPGGNIKIFDEALRVHPFFEERVLYNDNVYLSDAEKESEIFLVSEGGVRLDLFMNDHCIRALAKGTYAYAIMNDTEHNTLDCEFAGALKLDYNRVAVEITDTYSILSDLVDLIDTAGNPLSLSKFERDRNRAKLDIEWDLSASGKQQIGFFAKNVMYWHKETDLQGMDNMQNAFSLQYSHEFAAKTSGVLDLRYTMLDYDPETRNDWNMISGYLGVKMELRPKVPMLLKAGYAQQSCVVNNPGSDRSEYGGLVAIAKIGYLFGTKTYLELGYLRQPEYAASVNYNIVDKLELGAKHLLDEAGKWAGSLKLFGKSVDPCSEVAGDKYKLSFGGAASIEYNIQYFLTFGIRYEYRQQIEEGEYTNHRASLHATIYF